MAQMGGKLGASTEVRTQDRIGAQVLIAGSYGPAHHLDDPGIGLPAIMGGV